MDYRISELETIFRQMFRASDGNVVTRDLALPGCEGLTIFEEPLFSAASARDPIFLKYKEPGVIGEPFMTPEEWLPGAKSVAVLFFPFTGEVRASNRNVSEETSNAWLHGRIEGQAFQNAFIEKVRDWFLSQGFRAIIPPADPRFTRILTDLGEDNPEAIHFATSWSERHAAYAAGLGTFSLTRGLITKKGMAGRFSSVITDAEIEPAVRPYTGVYDYCIRCGACIKRCPVNAITMEGGKNQKLCREWVAVHSKQVHAPRYGCGKCQTGVPCEAGIPVRRIVEAG